MQSLSWGALRNPESFAKQRGWWAPQFSLLSDIFYYEFSFRLWSFSLLHHTFVPCTELVYTLWMQVPVRCEQSFVDVFCNIFLLYFCVADVDECASDSHQCNPTQICINTEGGYTCSCTEGYWLLEGQCLGKNLMQYVFWASVYVYLWIAEITSLSIFVKYTIKPSALWTLSFVFVNANGVLGRETLWRNKNEDVNAIWLASMERVGFSYSQSEGLPFISDQ